MMLDSNKVSIELVNKGFGTNLAELRKKRGYSQADLGAMMSLSRGTISNIESGVQSVNLHQTFRFAFILDVPVVELLPLMKDVTRSDGSLASSDEMFLDLARRLLMNSKSSGDDDENT